MPEPTALADDLDRELRSYFAVTTSTQLPRRVTEMSARTLRARRSPVTALLAGGAGVVATAALVVVVATHTGSPGGAGSALSSGAGSANAPAVSAPKSVTSITYPGVDTARLAASGVLLLSPDGHGTAVLSAGQAQAAAEVSVGATAYAPGAAVLVFAELTNQSRPSSCLCWVVDVAVSGTAGAATPRTELVLVDAVTGRIAAALSGHGIP